MRFDSNRAWKEASAAVSANRELLLALAGVFFLLPSFAINLLVPQFKPEPGADPRAMLTQMSGFYDQALPYILLVGAIQLVGTLAILTLCTDRSRPTVGHAIGRGAIGALPCFGAQLLIGLLGGTAVMALVLIGGATGSVPVTAILMLVGICLFVWLWSRFSLVAPVVAVERNYNPLTALTRSWALTRGNGGRLLLFFFLLILAFVIVAGIILGLVGILLAITLPGEPARMVAAFLSSALTAGFVLYFIAALAAAHRQLAGPSAETAAQTFE